MYKQKKIITHFIVFIHVLVGKALVTWPTDQHIVKMPRLLEILQVNGN